MLLRLLICIATTAELQPSMAVETPTGSFDARFEQRKKLGQGHIHRQP